MAGPNLNLSLDDLIKLRDEKGEGKKGFRRKGGRSFGGNPKYQSQKSYGGKKFRDLGRKYSSGKKVNFFVQFIEIGVII